MLTTLTIVGTFTAMALILQYFLNLVIADDIETLQKPQSKTADEAS